MDEQLSFEFEPLPAMKGLPELRWAGKRPYRSTRYYPAQLEEIYGAAAPDGWMNKIFWGDNIQVMSHLLKEYRGKVDLIYIDPPFDNKADYKKKIVLKKTNQSKSYSLTLEEKQYGNIWTNDEYLQFMYERLILLRELLSDSGGIYLHCDYHKVHYLRAIMDEVFGADNHLNSLVWMYSTRSAIKTTWKRTHDDILFYKKKAAPIFNWDDERILEPLSESTIKKYKFEDETGRYRLCGRNITGSPIRSAKDVSPEYELTHPEWVVRDYLRSGKSACDYFFIDIENQAAKTRTDYPTQKPEELLIKLIIASTKPGDLVFDCFMGSGTTQAVAMKLGRRFLGADINLGSIQTTTKRLLGVAAELGQGIQGEKKYTGFEVYNVNNYGFFRNPIEARDLLIKALGIRECPKRSIWDGELNGRMIKIMPVNRIATKADLRELVSSLPYDKYEKMAEKTPDEPVERITIVCMGHEPDLGASLEQELMKYKVDIEVRDILKDLPNIQLKRNAEAEVVREGGKLIIREFYPLNLMQKLSLGREDVEEWRQVVDSVMIDWNYDGTVLRPSVTDLPGRNEFVVGIYDIPEGAGTIRVKITDLLSESLELEVR